MSLIIAQTQPSTFSSSDTLSLLKRQTYENMSRILASHSTEELVALNNDLFTQLAARSPIALNQTEGRLEGAITKEIQKRTETQIKVLGILQINYSDMEGWRKIGYMAIASTPSPVPRSPSVYVR